MVLWVYLDTMFLGAFSFSYRRASSPFNDLYRVVASYFDALKKGGREINVFKLLILMVVLFFLFLGTASAQLANSPWPMFQHDLNHTGRSPYNATGELDLKWSFPTGSYVRSSPAIASDGTIYFGSWDNNLYAFYPNGTLKWNYTTGGYVESSPAIASDGTIYFGSNDGKLYAFYPNGTLKWSFPTGSYVRSSPAIASDGTIYFGSDDGKLYALYPNGRLKKSFSTNGGVISSPAIASDGTIYFGSNDGKLYAFYPNGTLKWSFPTGSYVHSSPAIASDGTIYFGSDDGKFYALYPNGALKWNYTTGGYVHSSPAIASDGTIYFGSWDNNLYAFYPNGTLKWNYTTGGYVHSSPAIASDGTIYFGSFDGKLYAFYPNGTLKWNYTTNGAVLSSPAIASDGTIYFGSFDGKLYALSDLTPPRVSVISPQNNTVYQTSTIPINVSAIDPSGVGAVIAEVDGTTNVTLSLSGGYYTGTTPALSDGQHNIRIYANDTFGNFNSSEVVYFNISIPRLANSSWPMFQHDLNHTGRSPYNTSSLGGLKWSIDLGDIVSSPIIGLNRTIYVVASIDQAGTWYSKLYAIDTNGTVKWSTSYMYGQSNVRAPAIASDGTIYVGPVYGTFYAYYPNGTLKWSVGVYAAFSSPAISADGTIYVGDNIGRVFAIYPNGTIKWSFSTGSSGVHSSPAIANNGIIYIGSSYYNKLYALNPDGTVNCTFTASDDVATPAIGSDGTVYVGSYDGNLYALYPNCTLKWSFDTGDKIYSSPAIGKDGTIYVGSYNGKFYALYPNNTLKWNYSLGGNITWASPVIDGEGNIYIGSKDGKFYAFYPNGTLKWTVITGASIVSSPAIGNDGTIYLPGNDGVLYAITNKTQVMLSNSSWPMFMHDLKHTGRSPYKGYEEVDVKWMIDLGNGIIRPPVLGRDGTIYVGVYYSSSNTGRLFAIFPNGTIKWNYTINNANYGIDASPVVMSDGSVCIHSGAGGVTFHCLYPNGTLRWEKGVTVFASYDSSPAVFKDTIFFGTNGEFYAYTIDGSEKWHYPGSQISVSSSPAIDVDRETVYFQDNRGYLRAISLTGKERWVNQIGSSTYSPSSPAIDDNGTIYIGHKDGIFYAFYPNGTQKWNITLGVPIYSSPAIGNDGTVYFSTNNTLYAINPNGTMKWSFNTGSAISSASSVIDNSGVIYQCAGSNLLAFNSNGTLKWNFTASGSLKHMTPAIGDDGTIYIGTNDGKLYALSDVIPPKVNIISPQNTTYSTNTIPINVSATDPSGVNTVIAEIDGATNVTLSLSGGYYTGTTPALADGQHSIRIYANDSYGNVNASEVVYFSVDTTPPAIARVVFNGTAIGSTVVERGSANAYINWTVTELFPLNYTIMRNGTVLAGGSYASGQVITQAINASAIGTWNYTIIANDTSGNTASDSVIINVVDTTPPAITITSPANTTYATSSVALEVSANEAISFWWYSLDGANITFTPNTTLSNLSDGLHVLVVYANDTSGNIGSASVVFTIDTTPPAITIISPQNTTYSTNTIPINVSATDPSGVNTVIAEIDGATNVTLSLSGGYYTGTTPALADGQHSIRIYANDTYGNVNASKVVYFSVDTTAPVISVVYNPSPVEYGSEANLTFSITELQPDTMKIWWNGSLVREGAYGSGVFNVSVATNQLGWWNCTVWVNDTSGNENSTTTWVLVQDTAAPAIYVLHNPSPVEYGTPANITVNISEAFPATLVILENGTAIYNGSYSSGALNISVNSSTLGVLNYTLIANDTSGNVNTSEILVTVRDTTPPAISIIHNPGLVERTAEANITVSVAELLPDTMKILLNGRVIHQGSYGSGVFNITVDSSTVGWKNYTVWANDTSGNERSATAILIVQDTTPPGIAFVAPTPANASFRDEPWLYINITASEELGSAWLELWNGSWRANMSMQGSARSWHINVSGISEGVHSYRVWANDSVGNLGASGVRTFTRVLLAAGNATVLSANETKPVINASDVVVEASASRNAVVNLSAYLTKVSIGVHELNTTTSSGKADKKLKYLMVENATALENLSRITLKLYYSEAELGDLDENTLALFYWNGSMWLSTLEYINRSIPGGPFVYDAGRNTAENYVYAVVNHTSHWAVGGKIKQVAAAAPAPGGAYSPEAVLLANSIDLALAQELVSYLQERGIELHVVNASNFSDYSTKQYIIILGGHRAYEGVGDILAGILSEEEKARIEAGSAYIKKRSVFRGGDVVYIFAGRDRNATREAWLEVYKEVAREIEYNWG